MDDMEKIMFLAVPRTKGGAFSLINPARVIAVRPLNAENPDSAATFLLEDGFEVPSSLTCLQAIDALRACGARVADGALSAKADCRH